MSWRYHRSAAPKAWLDSVWALATGGISSVCVCVWDYVASDFAYSL